MPTDKICGRSLSSDHSGYCVNRMINKNPRWITYLWNCMSHDPRDQKVTYLRNFNFRSDFVLFRLMKNIIFNQIESLVGRNTSDHACQIFCSKSNWNCVSLIFPPRDYRGLNNEQSECLLRPHLSIPQFRFKKRFD